MQRRKETRTPMKKRGYTDGIQFLRPFITGITFFCLHLKVAERKAAAGMVHVVFITNMMSLKMYCSLATPLYGCAWTNLIILVGKLLVCKFVISAGSDGILVVFFLLVLLHVFVAVLSVVRPDVDVFAARRAVAEKAADAEGQTAAGMIGHRHRRVRTPCRYNARGRLFVRRVAIHVDISVIESYRLVAVRTLGTVVLDGFRTAFTAHR